VFDAAVVAAPNITAPGTRHVYDYATQAALLQPCLSDPSRRVRVAGFAVVCDLLDAKVPGFVTHDTLQPLMELMLQSSKVVMQRHTPGSAAPPTIVRKPLNNAIWSMVELANAIQEDIKPYVPLILEACVGVLKNMKRVERTCVSSAAVLLARCANIASPVMLPHLHEFLSEWLQAAAVNSDVGEKGEIQDVFIALYTSTQATGLFNDAPEAVVFFACSWFYPAGNKPPAEKHTSALQWLRQIGAAQPNGWNATVQGFDINMQRALGLHLSEVAPPGLAAAAAVQGAGPVKMSSAAVG
jgi:hypothetical protein